jgi:hypothetical protein
MDFAVGGEAYNHASAFKFTHLAILVTLANPLLELCRGHTLNSLFGQVLELMHVHEFLVKRVVRVAHNC